MSSKGNPPRRSHGTQDASPEAPAETPEAPDPGARDSEASGSRAGAGDRAVDPGKPRPGKPRPGAGGTRGAGSAADGRVDGSRAGAPARASQGRQPGPVESLLRTCVAPGYSVEVGAVDGAEQAGDVCIRKNGIDPRTGDRHAEELVVELVIERAHQVARMHERARAMMERGVRRVFALAVRGDTGGTGIEAGPLQEWVPAMSAWQMYARGEAIVDPCLYEPLSARVLLEAVEADRAVAQAVLGGRVDSIEEYGSERYLAGKSEGYRAGKDEGYREGKDEGYRAGKSEGYRAGKNEGYRAGANDGVREALLLLLRARGVALDEAAYARIAACDDMETLQRWLTRAADVDEVTALFDDA